jgi:leukotriene-A4 hydrolase
MTIHKILFLCFTTLFLTNCIDAPTTDSSTKDKPNMQAKAIYSKALDTHTYARPKEAVTKHLSLNLDVNFEKKQLKGYAKWYIENSNTKEIRFDTRDLMIEKVTIGEDEKPTKFRVSKNVDKFKGAALIVDIEPTTEVVTIYYATSPTKAAALDWVAPALTADKNHPALFTQGQAILTRTWIPCQDSPGIRITYDATMRVPKDLMAVMSATNPQKKSADGVYTFEMKQPIPAYLIALAVGDLEFRPIGDRTGIYAEPSVIDAAANEFADMEKMLIAAENLYGAYDWERYDVIVLPPSFPFGGMENPRLTFATPTIIAGDRSLTSLIAHELAHSWSGNLVTNATWDDFWLNEGFTVYFERRIMEALYGEDYANMLSVLGHQDLVSDIHDLEDADTHLKLDLKDRDPDDGMTDIAYEKGFFLLRLIEETVGRKQFDFFLNNYFTENAFKVMDTEEFIVYINSQLLDADPQAKEKIRLEEWIYGAGIPDNCPKVNSTKFKEVDKALLSFTKDYPLENIKSEKWSSHEWLHFLRKLPKDSSLEDLKKLDTAFEFTSSGNSEILNAWFQLTIPTGYKAADKALENFLMTVGRRKFLQPLYTALYMKDPLRAKRIYKNARENYHSVSTQTLDAIVL